MKVSYCTAYGSPEVLEIRECPIPVINSNEILIKVYASSATTADSLMRQGQPKFARLFLGLRKPKKPITGTGFSGEIVDLGVGITSFNIGDLVFGETVLGFGSNAEYVKVSATSLILMKPKELSHNECATLCDGFLTSYSFLKDIGQLKYGQKIIINGASGSLGSAAVQIAKHMGAYVVGVCSSNNTNMVLSLGADKVIDYNKVDFTKLDHEYDLVFDTIGQSSFSQCKTILKKFGKYLSPVLNFTLLYNSFYTSIFSKKKALFSATGLRPISELSPLLIELATLFSQRKLYVVMDKIYPLEDIVKAHQYIDTGRKKGNIAIVIH